MNYSIGEISKMTGLPISTLRYYDKEGLFPDIDRSTGGIRVFTDNEIGAIKTIECLKSSGLSIQEIKQYMQWYKEGDDTLQKRHDLFYDRLTALEEQMKELQKIMAIIKFKCWYYDQALSLGSEQPLKNQPPSKLPPEIYELAKIYFE